jgi:hypothetical protein
MTAAKDGLRAERVACIEIPGDQSGNAGDLGRAVGSDIEIDCCRSASNPDPPKAPAGAKPSGATLRCAPSVLAQRLHNLEGGHLFDADPGQQFKAV